MSVATVTAAVMREAVLADVPALVQMGQRFRQETAYADRLRNNPEQMTALAEKLIADANGVVFVTERDGVLVGMIGLLLFAHHLSGDLTVGELFFWVEPEHRGHGVRLLRCAERWARAMGATTMQMIAPTTAVGQFYERLGYAEIEVAYEKVLQGDPICQ